MVDCIAHRMTMDMDNYHFSQSHYVSLFSFVNTS